MYGNQHILRFVFCFGGSAKSHTLYTLSKEAFCGLLAVTRWIYWVLRVASTPGCGRVSRTSSPMRPPSRWWWRAGPSGSSTASYSSSSSPTSSGQYYRSITHILDLPVRGIGWKTSFQRLSFGETWKSLRTLPVRRTFLIIKAVLYVFSTSFQRLFNVFSTSCAYGADSIVC